MPTVRDMSTLRVPTHTYVPEWSLGDRLRKAREACGMSQVEVALAAGTSQRSVSNYEADVTVPSFLVLREWADACQTDFSWLAWGDPDKPPPTKATWSNGHRRATGAVTIGYPWFSWPDRAVGNVLVAAA